MLVRPAEAAMEFIVVAIAVLALYLAFKAVGLVLRLVVWAVVIGAVYWLLAPHLGLPLPG